MSNSHRKKKANNEKVKLIHDLAKNLDRVKVTDRVEWEIWQYNLKVDDVRDAICDWIDNGMKVMEDSTKHIPRYAGKQHYIFQSIPILDGKYYVKVGIGSDTEGHYLLIISTHQ